MVIIKKRIPLIALFAALSSIGAFIRVPLPFTDVFITMQVAFVVLSGLLLGARDGLTAQGVYVLIGLIGVPVFSKGGGIYYAMNYEFGYLLGFLPMAYVVGYTYRRLPGRGFICALGACVAGIIVFYFVALIYIYALSEIVLAKPMTIGTLFLSFCGAFLPLDAVKIVIAAFVGSQTMKRLPPHLVAD